MHLKLHAVVGAIVNGKATLPLLVKSAATTEFVELIIGRRLRKMPTIERYEDQATALFPKR